MKTFPRLKRLQRVFSYAAAHLDEDVSLSALARHAGMSPFHLHRLVSAATRETPKQLTLRLRLARAAVLLLTSNDSVLDVALACGFQSHEVFAARSGGASGSRRASTATADLPES